jgi:hypothetical protein
MDDGTKICLVALPVDGAPIRRSSNSSAGAARSSPPLTSLPARPSVVDLAGRISPPEVDAVFQKLIAAAKHDKVKSRADGLPSGTTGGAICMREQAHTT